MKALVTGGGGFLGEAIVRRLRSRDDAVRVLARGDYPALSAAGCEVRRGDVRDAASVAEACRGVDVVFHVAAKAGGWGDPAEYEAINVGGTRNVVEGAKAGGVRAIVHTSTPSVVHGRADIEGADESIAPPARYTADYPRTKAAGERLALDASAPTAGPGAPAVVALRPHLIWGPGDRHLLPRLLDRARRGKLRRIGSRDPLVDTIYVDNCVDAHLLAADRLLGGRPIGGRVYFVSDGAPVGVWTMADRLLGAAGHPPIRGRVPAGVAYAAGAALEAAHRLLRIDREPFITRFGASQLAHAQWFDISAARRDLGYEPRVSIDEGLRRVSEWYRENGSASSR